MAVLASLTIRAVKCRVKLLARTRFVVKISLSFRLEVEFLLTMRVLTFFTVVAVSTDLVVPA